MSTIQRFSVVATNGTTYFLNTQMVTLRGGRTAPIYYFSRDVREATACALPVGYEIAEGKNGLPHLKKIKAA